jgi:hypothetical protein
MAQVVECLLGNHKGQGSILSTTKEGGGEEGGGEKEGERGEIGRVVLILAGERSRGQGLESLLFTIGMLTDSLELQKEKGVLFF